MKPPPTNRNPSEFESIELPDELPHLPEIELPDDFPPLPKIREMDKLGEVMVDEPSFGSEAGTQCPPDAPSSNLLPFEALPDPPLARTIENGSGHAPSPQPSSKDLLKALCEVGFEVARLPPSGKRADPPAHGQPSTGEKRNTTYGASSGAASRKSG